MNEEQTSRLEKHHQTTEEVRKYSDSFKATIHGEYTDIAERQPVVESMSSKKVDLLLDAGCGTGRFLSNIGEDIQFVGLDCSFEMVKFAKEELGRGWFIVGELENLPIRDNIFDEVICVRVLQHIRNQQRAIDELTRVCRGGGNVLILSYNTWSLLCLYKQIRMSKMAPIINYPLKLIMGESAPFFKWDFSYDNYCSLLELCRMIESSGLKAEERKGGTIGCPWVFDYFPLVNRLQRMFPSLFRQYFQVCRFLERRLCNRFPFYYFWDMAFVRGRKIS